jgi:mannosyltransferase OCH1-like enzyme
MPARWAAHLDAWQAMHPEWESTLWTDDTLPPMLLDRYMDAGLWSPKSNPGQWRANLVRYQLLLAHGGFWIDCDLEPRRPIDALTEHEMVVAWESQGVWINNALMGARPGHPALVRIVADIPRRVHAMPRVRSNRSTGAHFLTPLLRGRADVTVLDQHLVYPVHWTAADLDAEPDGDPFCVHRWAHTAAIRAARSAAV